MHTINSEEQALSRICGYLEAFAQLNNYVNHHNSYCFLKVDYNGDLSNSIKQYFENSLNESKKKYPDIKFCNKVPIRNLFYKEWSHWDVFERTKDWKVQLDDVLNYRFLGIFKSRFKSENSGATEDLKYTKRMLLIMIDEFLNNRRVEVYSSGVKNGYSCITECWGECGATDFVFLVDNKELYILHFGVSD